MVRSCFSFPNVTLLVVSPPGKPSFTKKQADLFFPPDFADDFPVAIQVSRADVTSFVCSLLNET